MQTQGSLLTEGWGGGEKRGPLRAGDVHLVYLRGNVQAEDTVGWEQPREGAGATSHGSWSPGVGDRPPPWALWGQGTEQTGTSGRGAGPGAAQNPEAESRVHSACGLRQAPCLQSCQPGRLQKPQGPSSRGAAPLTSKDPPPRATERPTQPGSASRSPGPCLGLSPSSHFREATCRQRYTQSPASPERRSHEARSDQRGTEGHGAPGWCPLWVPGTTWPLCENSLSRV